MIEPGKWVSRVGVTGAALAVAAALAIPPVGRAQQQPEVWQLVTFRFQPGRGAEANAIFKDLIAPIYRDNPHLLTFRAYREVESPVPLDLIVASRYAGMAGMDESNRWHQQNAAATGRGVGPLYGRLSDLSVSHDDQFIEILPSLTVPAKTPSRLTAFEWIRVIPGGRARYQRILEANAVPWERDQSTVKGSRTGRVLVGDGWDYGRLIGFDSLGDFHATLTNGRAQPFAAELDTLVATRRTIIVRDVPELAIR